MLDLQIRPGSDADRDAVLEMFDEKIEWLVARGLVGQWGEVPFTARPEMSARVHGILSENEVRIAEHDGAAAGVLAVGAAPPYVPPDPLPELYVTLVISARRLAGNAIGARLLALATEMARDGGAQAVRVDCWADAPGLVKFYERQGFARQGRFDLRGWRGQILSKSTAGFARP